MDAVHVRVQPIRLDALLDRAVPVLARRAEPRTRVDAPPPREPTPFPQPEPRPRHYDRWEVLERLDDRGPAPGTILELLAADTFVQESLSLNPHAHPVQTTWHVEDLAPSRPPKPGEPAILFLNRGSPGGGPNVLSRYAFDGLLVSAEHAADMARRLDARRPALPRSPLRLDLVSQVTIRASREAVWEVFADAAAWPSWNPVVAEVSAAPERWEPGARLAFVLRIAGRRVAFDVGIAEAAPDRVTWTSRRWTVTGTRTWTFRTRGNVVVVEDHKHFVHRWFPVGWLYPRRPIRAMSQAWLAALRAHVER